MLYVIIFGKYPYEIPLPVPIYEYILKLKEEYK